LNAANTAIFPTRVTISDFPSITLCREKHGGEDSPQNLALCCLRCNLCKGTNLTGIDPTGNEVAPLFNPRFQVWHEHFHWNGPILIGLTPTGRTTILVLRINAAERIQLREMLLAEGTFRID
jgi:hypothetical protein